MLIRCFFFIPFYRRQLSQTFLKRILTVLEILRQYKTLLMYEMETKLKQAKY